MKFYGRNQEIVRLLQLDEQSHTTSVFTLLLGRRRTGKTTLVKHAFQSKPLLYFFVSSKTEAMICKEFQQSIESLLGFHIYGQVDKFASLLRELMIYSQQHHVTLMIDEFQRLYDINPAIMSEIQDVWDTYKDKAHIHLIACGSVYSMMLKIFRDKKEPLFGRATAEIRLQPFSTELLKQILSDSNPNYTSEDLLMLYTISGGVAKYVELLIDDKKISFSWNISLIESDIEYQYHL